MKKTKELELDLIEVRAYRALQDETFGFIDDNEKINEHSSMDAIYEMQEQNIVTELKYRRKKKR